ncbi:helix-turn-helix transcriptional regulator (plasmid) [Rhizobium sp. CB3171]|uniref:helix-turn-helix transcriptional regulator n=1 Tax=Rhizobium sp. CB3171 TaxID=3039157 RepID=UPI0024B04517|nr:helix-turn-helix transcriptional regulator [Rhizobium sp. CB3171]WFU04634.1 helix-turn-helix transcriptional regulator [Rhizobium sp. CB3171]
MPENSKRFALNSQGSSFDGMVEALTGAFGSFNAEPVDRHSDFRWSIDIATCEPATLITGYHEHPFQFQVNTTENTSEYLSIVFPRRGGMGVQHGSSMADANPTSMLIYNSLEADLVKFHGQSSLIDELLLDWRIVHKTIAETFDLAPKRSLELLAQLDVATPAGGAIANLAEFMIVSIRNNGPLTQCPLAMARIMQALTDLVVRLVPHRLTFLLEKKPSAIVPWHVRRAIDFMYANIDLPITMPTIAEAVGVSVRTLEIGFRAFKETTPNAYLQLLRLRAAREDLLNADSHQTIQMICLKWGFVHFGRFSAVYKAHYGESPSQTRKRIFRPSGDDL